MTIRRLSDTAAAGFAEIPELAMGVQLGQADGDLYLVIGGEIAVSVDTEGAAELAKAVSRLLHDDDDPDYPYVDWQMSQSSSNPAPLSAQTFASLTARHRKDIFAFTMRSAPYVPAPPPAPGYVYGHLPFTGTTSTNDVFLRFEPWPNSRRLVGTTVAPGTYAAPVSERPLVPNGFAAVGRYALPNLFPACTVWEITPKAGTRLAVGASVPLYGQAGGGAEVCFTTGARGASIQKLPSLSVL